MIKRIFFLFVLACCSCKSDTDIVTQYQWKFGEGYRVGDFVTFTKNKTLKGFSVHNDTIYKEGVAVATADSVWHHVDHYMLQIRAFNGETGLYFEKGKKK